MPLTVEGTAIHGRQGGHPIRGTPVAYLVRGQPHTDSRTVTRQGGTPVAYLVGAGRTPDTYC